MRSIQRSFALVLRITDYAPRSADKCRRALTQAEDAPTVKEDRELIRKDIVKVVVIRMKAVLDRRVRYFLPIIRRPDIIC